LGEREEEAAFWADLSFQARDHKNRTCCERESEEAAFQTDQTFQLAQLEDRQTDRQTDAEMQGRKVWKKEWQPSWTALGISD